MHFAINLVDYTIVDTLPLRGRQVIGIAVKGDTVFYVNDKQYTGDVERIYAYSKTLGDTIFSFPTPDPDGTCVPRGLYWDGSYLWLLAQRIGGTSYVYKTLYKYSITGQGNPVITTSSSTLDFGVVPIGTSGQVPLTVSNTGTADLIINSFVINNPVFSIPGTSLPDTIPAGGQIIYNTNFTPAAYDSAFGTLAIHSNDGGTPIKNIALKGKGVYQGAYIYLVSNQFNYGGRRVNSNCMWDMKVENHGNIPLQINSFSTSTSRFVLDTTGVQFPVNIPSQSYRVLKVWFKPNSVNNFTDSLVINSLAVNEPVKKVYLSGTGFQNPAVLGEVLWQMTFPLNPNSYTNDLEPTSMKMINDVNNDGIKDLIITARNYYTICVNGNSSVAGDVIWKFDTGYNNNNTGSVGYQDGMQVRSDVDGDGVQDVVIGVGGGNEMVYTISGRTGNTIWAYGDSINYSDGDINGLRADKDFNGDTVPDVLLSASGSSSGGRHAAICLNGLNGMEIFNMPQPGQYTFDITTLQTGGVICVDQNNGGPYYLYRFNNSGGPLFNVQVPDVVWSLKETKDVNNDGVKDFVGFSGGMNVNVYSRSGANGAVIWNHPFPNFATFANIHLISDLDSNGYEDMIFSGKEGIYRYDTKTGSLLWSNPLDYSYTMGVEELVDLNDDNYKEVLAGTLNANIYLLDGLTGSIINQYNTGAPVDNAVERITDIFSIDGNYSHEFTAGTDDGRIICYSGGPFEPVPVELNSFTAVLTGKDVLLKWSTATELNNKGFEVERRNVTGNGDGEIIAFVPGKGTYTGKSYYSYVDPVPASGKYIYKLYQLDLDGTRNDEGSIEIDVNNLPREFSLGQNYPNPFNPVTTIKYSIPMDSRVKITIFNSLGQVVEEIPEQNLAAGFYDEEWSAGTNSSGVYYYSLEAIPQNSGNKFYSVKKMLLLK